MRAVWAWRVMMLVAVPSLALVGMSVAMKLPYVVCSAGGSDCEGLFAWAAAAVVGALLLMLSVALRRAGKLSAAIIAVSIVALPTLFVVGVLLLIVFLFIIKPG